MTTPETHKKSPIEILEIIAVIALFFASVVLTIFLIIVIADVYGFAAEFLELMYSQ